MSPPREIEARIDDECDCCGELLVHCECVDEDALEDHEERRRSRMAEQQEY